MFETLEKVEASGKLSAQWVDPFPLPDAYYRIRMYNLSGRVAESPIVAVSGTCQNPEVVVLGNPIRDEEYAIVKFTAKTSNTTLTLTDAEGRLRGEYQVATQAGTWNALTIPLKGFLPGIYLITTSDGASTKMVLR